MASLGKHVSLYHLVVVEFQHNRCLGPSAAFQQSNIVHFIDLRALSSSFLHNAVVPRVWEAWTR